MKRIITILLLIINSYYATAGYYDKRINRTSQEGRLNLNLIRPGIDVGSNYSSIDDLVELLDFYDFCDIGFWTKHNYRPGRISISENCTGDRKRFEKYQKVMMHLRESVLDLEKEFTSSFSVFATEEMKTADQLLLEIINVYYDESYSSLDDALRQEEVVITKNVTSHQYNKLIKNSLLDVEVVSDSQSVKKVKVKFPVADVKDKFRRLMSNLSEDKFREMIEILPFGVESEDILRLFFKFNFGSSRYPHHSDVINLIAPILENLPLKSSKTRMNEIRVLTKMEVIKSSFYEYDYQKSISVLHDFSYKYSLPRIERFNKKSIYWDGNLTSESLEFVSDREWSLLHNHVQEMMLQDVLSKVKSNLYPSNLKDKLELFEYIYFINYYSPADGKYKIKLDNLIIQSKTLKEMSLSFNPELTFDQSFFQYLYNRIKNDDPNSRKVSRLDIILEEVSDTFNNKDLLEIKKEIKHRLFIDLYSAPQGLIQIMEKEDFPILRKNNFYRKFLEDLPSVSFATIHKNKDFLWIIETLEESLVGTSFHEELFEIMDERNYKKLFHDLNSNYKEAYAHLTYLKSNLKSPAEFEVFLLEKMMNAIEASGYQKRTVFLYQTLTDLAADWSLSSLKQKLGQIRKNIIEKIFDTVIKKGSVDYLKLGLVDLDKISNRIVQVDLINDFYRSRKDFNGSEKDVLRRLFRERFDDLTSKLPFIFTDQNYFKLYSYLLSMEFKEDEISEMLTKLKNTIKEQDLNFEPDQLPERFRRYFGDSSSCNKLFL